MVQVSWDASESEDTGSSCSWPIPTYQAILLHIIFAILHKDRGARRLDLKSSLPPAEAELLRRLVASCKKLGLLYYPNMLLRYCEHDLPAFVWISIEEVKRFNLALYNVCMTCGEKGASTDVLDTATVSSNRGLRAQDLQFPLPRNTPLWNALSKAEWVSAEKEDVHRHALNDNLEDQWISKSAHILEALHEA